MPFLRGIPQFVLFIVSQWLFYPSTGLTPFLLPTQYFFFVQWLMVQKKIKYFFSLTQLDFKKSHLGFL